MLLKDFENIVGEGENAVIQHFSPFPTMFSTLSSAKILNVAAFDMSSTSALKLVQSKNWCLWLNIYFYLIYNNYAYVFFIYK